MIWTDILIEIQYHLSKSATALSNLQGRSGPYSMEMKVIIKAKTVDTGDIREKGRPVL
jgi:hypothetical protein